MNQSILNRSNLIRLGAIAAVVSILSISVYHALFVGPLLAEREAEARGITRVSGAMQVQGLLTALHGAEVSGDLAVSGDIMASSLITDDDATLNSLNVLGNLTATLSSLGVATGTSFNATNLTATVSSLGTASGSSFNATNLTATVSSLGSASATGLTIAGNVTATGLSLNGSGLSEIGSGLVGAAAGETIVAHGMGVTPTLCLAFNIGDDTITRTLAYTVGDTVNFYLYATAGVSNTVAWECIKQ